MERTLWEKCLDHLEGELTAQQFNTWIRPLQAVEDNGALRLLAPNRFVLDWVNERFIDRIIEVASRHCSDHDPQVQLEVGSQASVPERHNHGSSKRARATAGGFSRKNDRTDIRHVRSLQAEFTFENFVEGKSNQLARAASTQIAENPGTAYNPLFIYGGVGLGKTHFRISRQKKCQSYLRVNWKSARSTVFCLPRVRSP